jgi:hypothetical protein
MFVTAGFFQRNCWRDEAAIAGRCPDGRQQVVIGLFELAFLLSPGRAPEPHQRENKTKLYGNSPDTSVPANITKKERAHETEKMPSAIKCGAN